MSDRLHQDPTTGVPAKTYAEMLQIVTHPALRLGFLDAHLGRPFSHDRIMRRIVEETPPRALDRVGWMWSADAGRDFSESRKREVELAQYRYEEGRLLVCKCRLRCRGWGHPDYPPRAVLDFIAAQTGERPSEAA